jgi:hypothetical protein
MQTPRWHTWLEIIVDDWWLDLVEVFEGRHNLHDNGPSLPLRNCLVLFQVEVEVMPITVLQHGAEGVSVNFKNIIQLDHSRMVQSFVDVIFSQCMSANNSELQ